MRRAFRYRWYPTSEQAALLARTFGCVRYVWNRALAERADAWRQRQQHTSYEDTSAWLTRWKRDVDTAWLNEVSSVIRENQTVAVEDLNVAGMVSNRSLARSISDAAWGELVRQFEYKAAWYGRTLVKVDRWYPSSKRCSDCGWIREHLPLDVRAWTCGNCRVVHDRDHNAARNILAAGLAVTACGEGVRPPERHAGNATLVETGISTREG